MTDYFVIKRKAADRLEADLQQFVERYDEEMGEFGSEDDGFRILLTASAAIDTMIRELRRLSLDERVAEIEKRLKLRVVTGAG